MVISGAGFIQAECPSCLSQPTSVKALSTTQTPTSDLPSTFPSYSSAKGLADDMITLLQSSSIDSTEHIRDFAVTQQMNLRLTLTLTQALAMNAVTYLLIFCVHCL